MGSTTVPLSIPLRVRLRGPYMGSTRVPLSAPLWAGFSVFGVWG